jgi:hypothetical protein
MVVMVAFSALAATACGGIGSNGRDATDVMGDIADATEPGDDTCEGGWSYIDFPCNGRFGCIDLNTYFEMETYWCNEPCCSGGECHRLGEYQCPEGTLCYGRDYEDGYGLETNPCRGNECNIAEGRLCDEGYFCETLPGTCGGPGVCLQKVSGFVHLPDDEDNWTYTCGCDELTYKGRTARMKAGISAAIKDQCCFPDRLGLTVNNPEGYTSFLVCVDEKLDTWDMPDDVKALVNEPIFGPASHDIGCTGYDGACVGQLTLTETGAIDPVQIYVLCRLASFPGIISVVGQVSE